MVYVVGSNWTYGPAYAHDIGGGIKGTYIDLFFSNPSDCVIGHRSCTIYIISK